jgi:demethylmenaquinone methyltransferase/2-methoxy-6-polyprenyl-1,4-benzoquinol methylase
MTVIPYKDREGGKKKQIVEMFDNISHRYDLLNHMLSLGIDRRWRKKVVRLLKPYNPRQILDIATGTGDLAIESLSLNPDKIIGVDISEGMLEMGRRKIEKKGINNTIEFISGDSENLAFSDNNFDAVIVAFGVRNFENLAKGLSEMYRVLKRGGHAVVLEFSKPVIFPLKQLYSYYFSWIIPMIGKKISKDNSAYSYLPKSVNAFPQGVEFAEILREIGFSDIKIVSLSFGISTIYIGQK